ncbi:hypothetical protein GCM10027569_07570 [Flindersiella endophytica]
MGPGGLLSRLAKQVLETALDAEMTEHLGYGKHEAAGRNGGNSRNGTRTKTVLTDAGWDLGRWRSRCHVTPTPASTRRSWVNGNAGCRVGMRSCCRCRRRSGQGPDQR